MRRRLCGIACKAPVRLRALHSRMTIDVSWSGRSRPGNGASCWINAPSAASRGSETPGLAKPVRRTVSTGQMNLLAFAVREVSSLLGALGLELAGVRLSVPFELALALEGVSLDFAFVLDGKFVAIHLAIYLKGHITVLIFAVFDLGLHVPNGNRARQLVAFQLELDRHVDGLTVDVGRILPRAGRIGFVFGSRHAGDGQYAKHCHHAIHWNTSFDERLLGTGENL